VLTYDILGKTLRVSVTIDPTEQNCELCDINIVECWQAWRNIREGIAVAIDNVCHDIGLRKQHLGYYNNWDCLYIILLVWFWALYCVDVGSAY
jgi:hypothetical protein